MLTAYKSQRGRGALYALNAIVFWLKNAKMTANQMMRAAQELGIKPVSVVDRKVCYRLLRHCILAARL